MKPINGSIDDTSFLGSICSNRFSTGPHLLCLEMTAVAEEQSDEIREKEGSSASATGGQANEIGSNFRAGVAAWLAAHGLAGEPLCWNQVCSNEDFPVVIRMESEHSVDDLEVSLKSGQKLLIQAKSSCGLGKQFRDTVTQWVGQFKAAPSKLDDKLLLVTGRPTGSLSTLSDAVEEAKDEHIIGSSKERTEALNKFQNLARELGVLERQWEQFLHRVMIIELRVVRETASDFRQAASLLDSRIVRQNQGLAAMNALSRHFHQKAACRSGSNRENWLEALRLAHLEFAGLSEIDPGLDSYLRYLRDSNLPFRRPSGQYFPYVHLESTSRPVFTDDVLEEMIRNNDELYLWNPKMFDGFEREPAVVEVGNLTLGQVKELLAQNDQIPLHLEDAISHGKRNLVLGAPGSGKSTFLSNLGRTLASDFLDNETATRAVPLFASLARVADGVASDQTPSLGEFWRVVGEDLAQASVSGAQRTIEQWADQGQVTFLLDGLDEVPLGKQSLVEALLRLLMERYKKCRFVVTSRTIPYRDRQLPEELSLNVVEVAELSEEVLSAFFYAEGEFRAGRDPGVDIRAVVDGLIDVYNLEHAQPLMKTPLTLLMVMRLDRINRLRADSRVQLYN